MGVSPGEAQWESEVRAGSAIRGIDLVRLTLLPPRPWSGQLECTGGAEVTSEGSVQEEGGGR